MDEMNITDAELRRIYECLTRKLLEATDELAEYNPYFFAAALFHSAMTTGDAMGVRHDTMIRCLSEFFAAKRKKVDGN